MAVKVALRGSPGRTGPFLAPRAHARTTLEKWEIPSRTTDFRALPPDQALMYFMLSLFIAG